jgi:hypothetical protein
MVDDALTRSVVGVSEALRAGGAKYALIGGLAVSARGRPRATKDADFIVDCPALKLAGLFEGMKALGFELDVFTAIRKWQTDRFFVMYAGGVRVDWLYPVLPIYRTVLDHSEPLPWNDGVLNVATAEGLILCKMLAFRDQDKLDMSTLIDSNPGQLDIDFLRKHWQPFAAGEADRTAWLEAKLGTKLT